MTMRIELQQPTTAVAIGTPVAMDSTPFLGGYGRNIKWQAPANPTGTAVVLLQHAYKDSTGAMPAAGDAAWVTIATLNATSDIQGEVEVRDYVRLNTTVLQAAAVDARVYLDGVQ